MTSKKWWLWIAAALAAVAVLFAVFFFAGRSEELHGGTLVMAEEAGGYE